MADLMNIGRSGVMSAQKQLQVTSNNIANVGTPGYSRQVVEQRTSESLFIAGSFVGTGSYVADVKRIYNSYAMRELHLATSQVSYANMSWRKADELNQVFSVSGDAIPESMNNAFKAINNMADIPNDLSARDNVLVALGQLAGSFDTVSEGLTSQLRQTNEQVQVTVDRVNAITAELADINGQLMKVGGQDLQLLDYQNSLITELSDYVQVNVIEQDYGVKSVMMGGAAMLVSGPNQLELGTTDGDPVRHELRYTVDTGQNKITLDGRDVGGQLQALMDYRDNVLLPAERQLGKMALGIADAVNTAQANGFDLDGKVGQNLFADINSPEMSIGRSATSGSNAGGTEMVVNIDDTNRLTGGKYTLQWDGANYQLTDEYGTTSTLTVDPADPNRFVSADGFSIIQDTSGGAPVAGDKWALMPTASAAKGLNLIVDDPRALAAAGYTKETTAGDGEATLASVDRNNPALPAGEVNLSITPNDPLSAPPGQNTYTMTDADGNPLATGVYTGDTISALGFSVKVEDNTTATSSFKLTLDFAVGDNSNAVAMGKIPTQKLQDGGKSTLADTFQGIITEVGSQAAAQEVAMTSAQAVFAQAQNRVESESGVNLDEEAANLIRFQQAYQASARIMTVAKETFDTLFSSLR
ncbi:flagellar hook-associated protein FlgK [Ferrimonas sediminicola]|uniref:Flagellar hook-associated protein 1 n=1 Tax=Ferrimonas sediminicola TaxID=2569538 RepID=A0A4V5NUN9_9GAMM|nr:flagellar hook-associated protein FlgK [Ferrimonas sediminicola]TKB47253.1 flagellar hook-associated protein FlgK [Ferrimonas sediminicola]